MKIKKYAAIDIGSNAVRILVTNVVSYKKKTVFLKNALVRVPIRLGQDAFTNGKISDKNIKRMIKSMKAFKLLMEVHEVKDYLAFATSALREAKNGSYLVEKVLKKSGIKIEIIDGKKEAKIISNTNVFDTINKEKTFLYVDIGGGSTEFSVLINGKRNQSKSFKIGTVRMLNSKVEQVTLDEAESWVRRHTLMHERIYLLGTGGNINKLHKIANINDNRPLSYLTLNTLYNQLDALTYEERIVDLGLNPDRSDVILLAAKLFIKILNWSGAKDIYVPKVGLSDGMIRELYKRK
ncbi:exopolyphosphatase [Flavobacteriaceae bacterium]|jgi:exopolyphosphatase/guanosine-5'-triphosphate,3'-diphosphate pyrophosphatase|nr:exopolyphosphatase [Flavobacteriaceae bacterium]MDA8849298.1 exopolyphosphatase [Flavobacteriaceae bacterium]MDB4063553.1 exopolyphosphatase [Flavobacteriaceae bacterium]MDB4256147.1 exopolyphosphatase [Flavobacteriaceae bacterium]|tara:strand:+ start:237 stop:1118 length:882 start_codon:yes stop_codon:yes gene_type:complete